MNKKEAKLFFGKNLRRIRIEKKLSQDELARKIGYKGRSAINKIETGVNDMPRETVLRCAEALGVSPMEFFQEEDEANEVRRRSVDFDFDKLSDENMIRLIAYYQALLDSQEDKP